jgi:hypothetical protein
VVAFLQSYIIPPKRDMNLRSISLVWLLGWSWDVGRDSRVGFVSYCLIKFAHLSTDPWYPESEEVGAPAGLTNIAKTVL